MAGRRQHYIPRFLQRGFLSEESRGAERTWLHRRSSDARLVGIRDVGVAEYFYSKLSANEASTLDDMLTSLEHEIVSALNALRQHSEGPISQSSEVARLVGHLSLRTANIRRLLERGFAQVLDHMSKVVTDQDTLRAQLQIDSDGPTEFHREMVQALLRTLPDAAAIPEALLARMAAYHTREAFEQLFSAVSPGIATALEQVCAGISTLVQQGHNLALETSDQTQLEGRLSKFSWQVLFVEGAILPDCVAIAMDASGKIAPLPFMEHQEIEVVILPLAHDRLLVGTRGAARVITGDQVNRFSALCSDDFFIARTPQDALGLAALIGRRSEEVVDEAARDAIQTIRIEERPATPIPDMRQLSVERGSTFSFALTCHDFGDEDLARAIGQVLNALVGELSRLMPLSHLDGITFARDYSGALLRLDRGDPKLKVDASAPRDYGSPIAKCVHVLRAGISKQHLVVHAGVAMGLISDDRTARMSSVHILANMLAQAAHVVVAEVGLGAGEPAVMTVINQHLHGAVAGAPSRYFAARQSAVFDPNAGARYAELVSESLSSARSAVQLARLQYRVDDDVDALLLTALRHVTFVLDHAAEWLGHRDGLPIAEEFLGHTLPEELEIHGLHHWLGLLGQDLAQLYDGEGSFTNASILALDRHIERLLWPMLICPWVTPAGGLYVTVPMGQDELLLAAEG